MTTVTQRDIAARWAPNNIRIPLIWDGHPNLYVELIGDNDIPRLNIGGNHIEDSIG
jgi:hypothetical protein